MDTFYAARLNANKYVNDKSLKAAKEELEKAYEFIKRINENSAAAGDERLEAMLSDIHNEENENVGQIGKAISKADWFIKWGNSYLISLLTALQQQVCHNFKDKSVQNFGGALFEKLQEKAQTAFCTLPPPQSTGFVVPTYSASSSSSSANYSAPTYTAPTNMSNYYYAHGGCIYGEGLVKVGSSTPNSFPNPKSTNRFLKRVKDIQKNDQILQSDGSLSTVLCVVETVLPEGAELVKINDLQITPYHPVLMTNIVGNPQWQFPIKVHLSKLVPFHGTVYDFVLDRGHLISVDGIHCITLGHGRTDFQVIAHPYYGTQKIIEDLKKLQGWEEGRVVIGKLIRDPTTNLVIGFENPITA